MTDFNRQIPSHTKSDAENIALLGQRPYKLTLVQPAFSDEGQHQVRFPNLPKGLLPIGIVFMRSYSNPDTASFDETLSYNSDAENNEPQIYYWKYQADKIGTEDTTGFYTKANDIAFMRGTAKGAGMFCGSPFSLYDLVRNTLAWAWGETTDYDANPFSLIENGVSDSTAEGSADSTLHNLSFNDILFLIHNLILNDSDFNYTNAREVALYTPLSTIVEKFYVLLAGQALTQRYEQIARVIDEHIRKGISFDLLQQGGKPTFVVQDSQSALVGELYNNGFLGNVWLLVADFT